MPLSKEHLKLNPEERVVGRNNINKATAKSQFNRADMLLQEVLADITNGYTTNDIIMKFAQKLYKNQKKAIGEAQAKNYIRMSYLIMQENRVKEADKLRDQFYEQYLALFNDAVQNGNTILAKSILDSMSKTFLPDEKNINLNGNIDGNLTIDFNFNDESDVQLEND